MNRLFFDTGVKFRLARHFIFFLTVLFTFVLIFYVRREDAVLSDIFRVVLINSLFFLGYAYIAIFLLIPEFLLKNKTGWFLLLFILVGVGLSALKMMVSDEIFYLSISPERYSSSGMKSLHFILVNTKDMSFIVALFCVAKYAKDYIYTENLRRQLEKQHREAQRRLLQSQLNPHFLFNTINNLYALSLLEPAKTNEITDRLQIVLKYIVEQSQRDFVNLEDEFFLVENYILLEKIRYGERLKTELKKEGDLGPWRVPPMVLFFLAENCFKHGSSPDSEEPWIQIRVKTEKSKVIFTVANSKPGKIASLPGNETQGAGLKNLQKRLEILYTKDGYKFEIFETAESFSVKIELKKIKNEIGRKTYR
ncbi:MAG: sensor histidine kinase [Tangfeifania sp.]